VLPYAERRREGPALSDWVKDHLVLETTEYAILLRLFRYGSHIRSEGTLIEGGEDGSAPEKTEASLARLQHLIVGKWTGNPVRELFWGGKLFV